MTQSTKTLRGILYFHSETGTEGGYWAFQDGRFVTPNTTLFMCTKCHRYWDKAKDPTGLPDIAPISGSASSPENRQKCAPNEHDFQLFPKEFMSYEGLVILRNGDVLRIFSPADPSEMVWSGTVSLKHLGLFTEHAFGFWIHYDQENVERETWARWFLEGYPAELTPSPGNDLARALLAR